MNIHGVMVIVVANSHVDLSLNVCNSDSAYTRRKSMHPTILPPAMGK